MMKTYLKRAFQLSDSGVKGLAKSIWSFFLYYVSFVPPMICVFLFADRLLNGNTGKPVVYLLFMLAATLVMYLVINYNYKTTYDETYQESANLRIDLAEQLSKLPLSYFSKHNLSDLAQTIMADVASIEHAFANAVANSIGFAIYFLVISVALLIMNWKLGLCVLLPILTSASVLFLTKKLQVRDVNKHYDKLRDISESFQNAIELNQEIKSYGLKEKVEAQMDQQLDESENLQWKAQITQTIPVTIGQTLSILPIGITATVGLSMLASGQVSILILLGYIIMAAKLSGAMGGVLLYLTEIFYLDARIARIGEIKNHELQGGEKAVLSDFNVEIKDVSFSYQKDTQVIRHASFTAEQGQVTALVGPSGCGKTTMLKLISRLYTEISQDAAFGHAMDDSTNQTRYLGMNLNKAPFNDPLVREAVSYAVNQQELETSVFDGLETAAETLFTNEKPNCGVEVKTYPTDMEKAKQLMKEAGYEDTNDDGILEKDGTSLAIHFNYSQSLASVDNAVLSIAASLKELGFDVTIDAVDMNTWYGALMAGEYDLTFYNTAGGSFDPATDMSNMAPGAMGDPILCQFSAFFENPEIFAELDSTSDSQRVQEIYGMILNGIADQNLLVPVTGTHDLALWNTDKII